MANEGFTISNCVIFLKFDRKVPIPMNIKVRICILLHFLFFFQPLFAQREEISGYYKIKKNYENRLENDASVLPLVQKFINKARHEKEYAKLVEGYKDGLLFSISADRKLKYADSALWAAKLTRDDDLIGRAHTSKGIVYYFHLKKYNLALQELLIAYDYSQKSGNQYDKNKVLYLLGVVKSYIGYYEEALIIFRQTKVFFEEESAKDQHSNLVYGNKRGYYNSLHQMAVCYRNLGHQKLADSITDVGLSGIGMDKDYKQEKGYFLKEKGISEFNKRDYTNALNSLQEATLDIAAVNDFSWMTVCYSYIGKTYKELGDKDRSLRFLRKVDSIFDTHHFILPEVRSSYELMIDHYRESGDLKKQLYYTKQLLKADEQISRDFKHLSSKIHREYDTKILREGKSLLEKKISREVWLTRIWCTLTVGLIIILLFRYRREQQIRNKYLSLERKILSAHAPGEINGIKETPENNISAETKIRGDLLRKLQEFEDRYEFTESGLTLGKLALRFHTNQKYLSSVINESKGMNFNRYISELRISFITKKLYNEKKYLYYKIETLAEECGIASRNNFSDLFFQINGIRPTDFIRKRLADITNEEVKKGNNRETPDK